MKTFCSLPFLILIFVNASFTFDAQAYCADKLSQNHSLDAKQFSFESFVIGDWLSQSSQDFSVNDLKSAVMALDFLYASLFCQDTPKVELENSGCSQIKTGRSFSTQCYLETEEGYFFIHQDLMDKVYLNYHRWD